MMSSRRRKSQPKTETIKGRKVLNGRGGRRELDDPVTQVSAFCGTDETQTTAENSNFAPSHKSQRYISQISQSPSPPLGKIKKLHPKRQAALQQQQTKNEPPAASTRSQENGSEPTTEAAEEQKIQDAQQQELARADVPSSQVPQTSSTISMESIAAFLQELDKQTQCTTALPKFARFTSKRAARFELPVNLHTLENVTPLSYLHQYCIVTPTKEQSYQRIFRKHCKLHIEDVLKAQYLESALVDSFGRTFAAEELKKLHGFIQWDKNGSLDERDFVVIAALLERIICVSERETRSDQTRELDQKDELETADFSCLEDKLQGITVSQHLLALLIYIRNS